MNAKKRIVKALAAFALICGLSVSARAACVTASAGGGWQDSVMTSQTGTFTATFDATPSASPTNSVIALSNGAQTAYASFACLARFNTSGDIDARNGGAYAAASAIPYSANVSYHIRLVVNIAAQTYSIYVTPAGGSELTVGLNYAFRIADTTLNWYGVFVDVAGSGGAGSVTVCNFSTGGTLPQAVTPSFSPAPGSYGSAQTVAITTGTSGASIRYTTDGSTPSETAGTLYSDPVNISATTTLNAIAYANGYADSTVASGSYTIGSSSTWALTWSDEFNGPAGSAPDPSKWNYDVGGGGWGNNELEYYCSPTSGTPCNPGNPNISLDGNGNLVIKAIKDSSGNWTSGRMLTSGKFQVQYGRIEARMKLPVGAGIWPAFWMLGTNIGSVGWPTCGEQDIMEWVPQYTPSTTSSHIHGPGYSGANGIGANCTFPNGGAVTDAGYHIYGVIWSANKLQFYRDDYTKPFLTLTPSNIPAGTQWVYNQPFFLLFNLAIGGGFPGNPNSSTPNPAIVLVDWVRVYQQQQQTMVAAPVFSPTAGTYPGTQNVSITSATSNASIRYTTDASTPSETVGTLYSGPVNISSTTTLKALAYESGFTDSNVSVGTYTISATFTISASAGSGGSISPSGNVVVNQGANQTFTFNPPPGYYVCHVYVDGADQGAITSYTFSNCQANHTISVVFCPLATFSITASAGTGGSISPSGTVTVNQGASQAFTITPNTGFAVSSVTVDGTSVGAVTSYTFVSVQANHTISATFAASNRTLTGSSGNGFHALAISPAATGTFTATFDATPTVSPENAVVGLSNGAATAYGNLACIARFNPTGQIDAYNGTAYAAASSINYSANVSYHFRLVVNVTAHTYSVYVTPAGGSEVPVGSNYAFRSTANTMTSLNDWNIDLNATPAGSSLTVNNLTP